jgi:hypothetical protein
MGFDALKIRECQKYDRKELLLHVVCRDPQFLDFNTEGRESNRSRDQQ